MAGKDGKTEKATPQRRQKARREGQFARSTELPIAVSLAGAALVLKVFAPNAMHVLERETARLFSSSGGGEIPGALIGGSMARMAGAALVPFLAVGVAAALVSGGMQSGFRVSGKAAKPKLSNISPKKGLQRFKLSVVGWDLVRSLAKVGLLVALMWAPIHAWADDIIANRNLDAGLRRTLDEGFGLLLRAVLMMVVLAAVDYGYQRFKHGKDLRMSKQEVKQENKDSEGDPMMKAQRRRRAMEFSRNRMLSAVATADVVVTNPTHLAVALKYADGEAAPRVVAKGADRIAAKIRREAARNGVLITRNVPLARALYRRCKVGSYVPGVLYEAVAVVLALAYRRYGKAAA